MAVSLVNKVRCIAIEAHNGQYRRDGKTPYFEHVLKVAKRVEHLGDDYICTAYLHDVIEDTSITKDYLLEQGIPAKIVDAVVTLTKTDHIDYDDYIQNVRTNEIARAVKIADMLSNLADNPTNNQIKKYSKGLYILTRD